MPNRMKLFRMSATTVSGVWRTTTVSPGARSTFSSPVNRLLDADPDRDRSPFVRRPPDNHDLVRHLAGTTAGKRQGVQQPNLPLRRHLDRAGLVYQPHHVYRWQVPLDHVHHVAVLERVLAPGVRRRRQEIHVNDRAVGRQRRLVRGALGLDPTRLPPADSLRGRRARPTAGRCVESRRRRWPPRSARRRPPAPPSANWPRAATRRPPASRPRRPRSPGSCGALRFAARRRHWERRRGRGLPRQSLVRRVRPRDRPPPLAPPAGCPRSRPSPPEPSKSAAAPTACPRRSRRSARLPRQSRRSCRWRRPIARD